MDDGLKQRLVGAFVLLAIAVLFLPSLFQAEKGRRVDTRSQIPLQPELPPKPQYQSPQRVAGLEPAPEPSTMYQLINEPDPAEVSESAESAAPQVKQDVKVTAEKIAQAVETRVKEKASDQKLSSTPISERAGLDGRGVPKAWVIQVASFSEIEKAELLKAKLLGQKYKAYVSTVNTSKGARSRVFVGPKLDKEKAEQIKRSLDKAYKVNSLVVEFKA